MSRDFIGSKISIITKSQCRYTGTIIGIDAQTSSIVLGNIKSYGTENRSGSSTNGHLSGATLPIMQFANSDIEDLKIVDDEQIEGTVQQAKQQSYTNSAVSSSQSASIHDDPAIVSAVVSSTNQDNISNRLINNLQHMTLNDQSSKNEESRIQANSNSPWSKLEQRNNNNSKGSFNQQSDNKTKFFDSFIWDKNNTNIKRSSNTHSTQTFRDNNDQYDDNSLPVRQPFFTDDRPYPQKQYQQNRYQNGNNQYQQRSFYNNNNNNNNYNNNNYNNNRRPHISNHQRRNNGGNRETFQNNPNDYDADFDFETNNQKFNKITNIDDDNDNELTITPAKIHIESSAEYPLLYDKKKSFFDNLARTETNDLNNRSKNTETFGNDAFYQQNNRSNTNGYRRSNNNYRQGNNDFNSRQQNKNGYYYRY